MLENRIGSSFLAVEAAVYEMSRDYGDGGNININLHSYSSWSSESGSDRMSTAEFGSKGSRLLN